jgi:hypothetical protein
VQEEYKKAKKKKEDGNENENSKAGKSKTPAEDTKKNAEMLLLE